MEEEMRTDLVLRYSVLWSVHFRVILMTDYSGASSLSGVPICALACGHAKDLGTLFLWTSSGPCVSGPLSYLTVYIARLHLEMLRTQYQTSIYLQI